MAPQKIKNNPITYPLSASTYGSDRTPAPAAAETREKILPLTLPAVTAEKVLSLKVSLFRLKESGDIAKSDLTYLYPAFGEVG